MIACYGNPSLKTKSSRPEGPLASSLFSWSSPSSFMGIAIALPPQFLRKNKLLTNVSSKNFSYNLLRERLNNFGLVNWRAVHPHLTPVLFGPIQFSSKIFTSQLQLLHQTKLLPRVQFSRTAEPLVMSRLFKWILQFSTTTIWKKRGRIQYVRCYKISASVLKIR